MVWLGLLLGCSRQLDGPDIILLTVDTLRLDHTHPYAEDSPASTPALDALAVHSIRFDQAYSPISVTGPAFSSRSSRGVGASGSPRSRHRGGWLR
ncbi:MAG: hypothetical protein ACI8RZ_006898 [Myxococcota bacterium]|jgi:hypothetical protein